MSRQRMRHKHPAMVTVSEPRIRDWFILLTHNMYWAVQKNFVRTVRAVEWLIEVDVSGCPALEGTPNAESLVERLTQTFAMDTPGLFTPPVIEALKASFPTLLYIAQGRDHTKVRSIKVGKHGSTISCPEKWRFSLITALSDFAKCQRCSKHRHILLRTFLL